MKEARHKSLYDAQFYLYEIPGTGNSTETKYKITRNWRQGEMGCYCLMTTMVKIAKVIKPLYTYVMYIHTIYSVLYIYSYIIVHHSGALSLLISKTSLHLLASQHIQFTSVPWQNDNFLHGRVLMRYPKLNAKFANAFVFLMETVS